MVAAARVVAEELQSSRRWRSSVRRGVLDLGGSRLAAEAAWARRRRWRAAAEFGSLTASFSSAPPDLENFTARARDIYFTRFIQADVLHSRLYK